jgi:ABC-type Fe3+-siderophore transport system permease subunit
MSIAKILAVLVFAVMAVVQAVRFAQAWPVSINGYEVPVAASAFAAIAFAILAVITWRDGRRK